MSINFGPETSGQSNPEQEIQQLKERLKHLEGQGEVAPGAAVENIEQPAPSTVEQQNVQPPMPVINDDQSDDQQATDDDQLVIDQNINSDEISSKIQNLVKVALTDGLEKSISQAGKTKNPYLMDELHDTLVDHLYDQLIRMKKIKKDD